MLKKILIYVAGAIGLLFVLGFFLPKKTHVEYTHVLNHDVSKVYNTINELKTWNHWAYWNMLDSTMQTTYGEKSSGTGAWNEWTSENPNVGKGKMYYTDCKENEYIKSDLMMEGDTSKAEFKFVSKGDKTEVTWSMDADFDNGFVMKFLGGYLKMIFVPMIKTSFETSLKNLDKYLETAPNAISGNSSVKMEVKDIASRNVLTVTSMMTMDKIEAILGQSFGMVGEEIASQKLQPVSAPFAIYHEFSMDKPFKAEAGIQVNAMGKTKGKVEAKNLPATKVIVAYHYGSYEATEKTHHAINEYAASNKYEISGSPWEVYVTDPMNEKDTAKWLTEIYYPIK